MARAYVHEVSVANSSLLTRCSYCWIWGLGFEVEIEGGVEVESDGGEELDGGVEVDKDDGLEVETNGGEEVDGGVEVDKDGGLEVETNASPSHYFCVSGLCNLQGFCDLGSDYVCLWFVAGVNWVSRCCDCDFLAYIWVGISGLQVCVDDGDGDMVASGFGGGAFRSAAMVTTLIRTPLSPQC
ncbi:hypothetical protein V8G54_019354 [Vigna mungo]|uniref:Uncharacterized protein n=1 Tax=Vigna mungo TaxID=3915 RepID=A0AAQ3NCP2_VIGMU